MYALPVQGTGADAMLLGGLFAGSSAYFIAAPLWFVKTRLQTAVQAQSEGANPRAMPLHVLEYWRGCTPLVVRGALLSTGQMVGYDFTKRTCKRKGWLEEGSQLQLLGSCVGGICAATYSAPADVLMSRYLASGEQMGLLQCGYKIWCEGGVLGFFRGWSMNVARLGPTSVIGILLYEQTRTLLGLEPMQ